MVAGNGIQLLKVLCMPRKCRPKHKQKVELNLANQSRTEIEIFKKLMLSYTCLFMRPSYKEHFLKLLEQDVYSVW